MSPTSFAMSAKSRHSLILLSMCEDAAYEKRRLPTIPKPSRKTQTIAAAMAEAFSAGVQGGKYLRMEGGIMYLDMIHNFRLSLSQKGSSF